MCGSEAAPGSVVQALAMLERALDHLTAADVASLPAAVQAEALRALGRVEAKHTVAQARVLSAFTGQGGFEDDGHGTARTWLKWQTRVTHGAAVAAVTWARRVAAHPVIGRALAAGELSASWARQICEWTERLPEAQRSDADEILAGAARGGAGFGDLAGLAREMYERSCREGGIDPDDGRCADRWFRLGLTFDGAGRAEGDLTPGCAAALAAVLEALGKKAGPEDTRTRWQRRHDALEEACRRLIRAGMVPARAGQPTQVLVHLSLAQLRGAPAASAAEDAWAAARASQPGWLTGPDADAALCDATIVPVVTGHVDWAALDQLTETFLLIHTTGRHAVGETVATGRPDGPGRPDEAGRLAGAGSPADRDPFGHGQSDRPGSRAGSGQALSPGGHADLDPTSSVRPTGIGQPSCPDHGSGCGQAGSAGRSCGLQSDGLNTLSPGTRDRLRRALLGLAVGVLSGPDGLAARLRAALDQRLLTSVSLPLDIGTAIEAIPAHLRRAVTLRHPHCAFPGCDQPASVCDIHHIVPRSQGGPTTLPNLIHQLLAPTSGMRARVRAGHAGLLSSGTHWLSRAATK
jgi:Domain of unknown function (DUF222)